MIIKLCGTGAYEVRTKEKLDLDLSELKERLDYEVKAFSPFILIVKVNGKEVSIYDDGKLLVKQVEGRGEAETIAEEVYRKIKR